jgi:hypothetical protein
MGKGILGLSQTHIPSVSNPTGDNNLIQSNILKGQTILGMVGTGGKRYATGTLTTSVVNDQSYYTLNISSLLFIPDTISIIINNAYYGVVLNYSNLCVRVYNTTQYNYADSITVSGNSFSAKIHNNQGINQALNLIWTAYE